MAPTISGGASLPCTRTGSTMTLLSGQRLPSTRITSRTAAPAPEPAAQETAAEIEQSVFAAVQAEVEAELEGNGRLLVRPSGTEPLIRVMIEAQTQEQAERLAHRLADLVQERIGA